jgi:hypothetical protein
VVDDIEALYTKFVRAGVEISQSPEEAQWNPLELSMMFFDSENNLILVTSTRAINE